MNALAVVPDLGLDLRKIPDLADPATRARLSPAAIVAFFSIVDKWQLRNEDAMAMRMPVTMYGAADGITTSRKIWSWLAPRHCAARCRMIGARITPAVVAFFARLPGCTLHNHYGPSETHVVTAHALSGPPGQCAQSDGRRPPSPRGCRS